MTLLARDPMYEPPKRPDMSEGRLITFTVMAREAAARRACAERNPDKRAEHLRSAELLEDGLREFGYEIRRYFDAPLKQIPELAAHPELHQWVRPVESPRYEDEIKRQLAVGVDPVWVADLFTKKHRGVKK
jgi:hypothetical protein